MIDTNQLQQKTAKILDRKVLAVGIFDASMNIGNRAFAPAAAGVATFVGTKAIANKNGHNGAGFTTLAAVAGVAGALGAKKIANVQSANKKGLTPIMVCAITSGRIFLLDWIGSHKNGSGPTKILYEFSRSHSKIKTSRRGVVHHVVDIKEDDRHARIECNLGAVHSNKKMNKEVLKLLKESNQ